jgi:hypothetical protein
MPPRIEISAFQRVIWEWLDSHHERPPMGSLRTRSGCLRFNSDESYAVLT